MSRVAVTQAELYSSVNETCLSVFEVKFLSVVLRLGSLGDHHPCASCGIDDLAVAVVKEVLPRSLSTIIITHQNQKFNHKTISR